MCLVVLRAVPEEALEDLGAFAGPVLVFGGPYGNLQATTALLEQARAANIAPGNIICTGDVVAYCGDPQATVDAIRAAGIHVVMGNCEESLGLNMADCGCGFVAGSTCDLLSAQWFAHASGALDDGAKKWMAGLPRTLRFSINSHTMAVIHGGYGEISRFIFASSPVAQKRRQIDALGVDGVIGGHCGIPFHQHVDGRMWHNPGVIGMPANDATPRTWFSIIRALNDGIDFALQPLEYDYRRAVQAMHEANLPTPYASTLSSGLWPNMDILPVAERACKGQPVIPDNYFWQKD